MYLLAALIMFRMMLIMMAFSGGDANFHSMRSMEWNAWATFDISSDYHHKFIMLTSPQANVSTLFASDSFHAEYKMDAYAENVWITQF